MAITALQGLLETMRTALGQPRLLGKMAHALCAHFAKRLENAQTFLPKSHVGLVLQRVAELSPEFSSSAYMTDIPLSRFKRLLPPTWVATAAGTPGSSSAATVRGLGQAGKIAMLAPVG